MAAAAVSLLELSQYLDKAIAKEPKDVQSLSQSVRYLKNSTLILVQSGDFTSDQIPVGTVYDKFDKFVDMIADTLKKQGEQIKELEEDVQLLKKQIAELKDNLLVGQVALKLEREIVNHLLEGTKLNKEDMALQDLSLAVRSNPDHMSESILDATDSQVATIKDNWKIFEKKLICKPGELYRVIKKFKKRRIDTAHPNMPLSEATDRLRKADLKDKKSVDLMLNTLESLNVVDIRT